jgi:hypothetical protein
VAGDAVGCPVVAGPLAGQDALFASGSSWTLATTLDASSICEDLTLTFDYATDGARAGDSGSLSFGEPLQLAWAAYGAPAAEGVFQRVSVDLAHRNPELRFDADVEVSFALVSGQGTLLVDDVEASGATCAAGDASVTIRGPTDVGSGLYDVAVVSAIRTRTYLTCSWDARAALRHRAAIDFLP